MPEKVIAVLLVNGDKDTYENAAYFVKDSYPNFIFICAKDKETDVKAAYSAHNIVRVREEDSI